MIKKNPILRKVIYVVLAALLAGTVSACAAFPETESIEEGSIGWIALMNGCSVNSLNMVMDSEGYVEFLGGKHTDKRITNAAEALESIAGIAGIAGLEGLEFTFRRKDVSPVTQYTYYTFAQISRAGTANIEYFNSCLKIIADSQGNARGFSARVNRNPDDEIRNVEFITRTEAEEFVESLLPDGAAVLSDYSTMEYWSDEVTSARVSDSRVIPVWMVVTDEPSAGKLYTTYLVYAVRDYDMKLVDRIASDTPADVVDLESAVSQLFFFGLEDAGEYTYLLDMKWAVDAGTGYSAGDTLEVTVPVAYNPANDLYYLADVSSRIAVTNNYDFAAFDEINTVVTKTPEDINSWHFVKNGSGEIMYFCNPNYIVASYWCMCNVCDGFAERYGESFLKTISPPVMLGVYLTEGSYPDTEDGFTANASSAGQIHGWNVFLTAPTHSACISFGSIAHEFAHGINSQLSSTRYYGETGAVVEGFADAIGEQLAYVSGYKQDNYKWLAGSEYSQVLRNWKNPVEYRYAKYIGGVRYISPADEAFNEITDNDGVHINGGTVNYLTYAICNGYLDISESLDMWLETVYCSTYTTGFEELGAHLVFAAESMELDEEKIKHVKETVKALGFDGEGTETEVLPAEESFLYSVKVLGMEELPENTGIIITLESSEDRLVSGEPGVTPESSGESMAIILAEREMSENYRVYAYIADKDDGEITEKVPLQPFENGAKIIRLCYDKQLEKVVITEE